MRWLFWILASIIGRAVIGGFVLMIIAGNVHIHTWAPFPPLGLVACFWLSIALTALGSYFYPTPSKD